MKDFMLMYKGGNPEWMSTASEEEKKQTMAAWGAWMGALQAKEQLAAGGSPLAQAGKTISGDGVVTDLVASELKELVTGYSIIRANDIAEATAIAKECPIFNYPGTSVDVREVSGM